MVKLRQLCGGTIIDDDKIAHRVGREKLDLLCEMINEWNMSGILIWYNFGEEGQMINDVLKKRYTTGLFNGALSAEERSCMISDFESGNIEILILQNDAGHLGITLNKSTHSVFYSNHLRPVVRNQAERRNWRIGQKHPVFYYDLLCKGTIDEWIYKRLMTKRKFNSSITDTPYMTKKEAEEICYGQTENWALDLHFVS
jgi:SNF2 family DNA or RNA helicase